MKRFLLLFVLFLISNKSYSLNATLNWANKIGGDSTQCTSIATDLSGNIFVGGFFIDTVDFDPSNGISNLISNGGTDAFIAKYDSLGNFIWAKNVGGFLNDKVLKLGCDFAGNIYVGGHFDTTGDFDPGPGIYQLVEYHKFFLLKLNSSGNFVWAHTLTDQSLNIYSSVDGVNMDFDKNGNCYVVGWYNGVIDFDPGTSVFSLNSGFDAAFILKLNSSGVFQWVINATEYQAATGVGSVSPSNISVDANGNVVVLFDIQGGDWDLDPNPTNDVIVSWGQYIVKYDANGNYNWHKGYYSDMGYYNLDVSDCGDIYLGVSYNTIGEVGNYTFYRYSSSSSNASYDMTVAKITSNGYISWAKQIRNASPWDNTSNTIFCDGNNSLLISGYFQDTLDIDPGPLNNFLIPTYNNMTGFVIKLDTASNLIYGNMTENDWASYNYYTAITKAVNGHYYITGDFLGSVDYDPKTTSQYILQNNSSNLTGVFASYYEDPCFSLYPMLDSINNISCTNANGYIKVHGSGGTLPYSYTWLTTPVQNSQSISPNAAGIYKIKLQDALGCIDTVGYVISSPIMTAFDLGTSTYNSNIFWMSNNYINLNGYNLGCIPQNGSLSLILDTLLTYQSAIPSPNQISGDTLTWNFSSFNNNSTPLQVSVLVTTSGNVGDTAKFTSIITPISGDIDVSNNIAHYYRVITGSFDPNDIIVSPQGQCDSGYVLTNTTLTYTIDFQNTGNYPAANIYILDSLNASLDINTIKILNISHNMYTEVLPNDILKFRFDNINLPDWGTNDSLSRGYVTYQIKHKNSIPNGSLISNHADIFFDNNPPIITNEVFKKL